MVKSIVYQRIEALVRWHRSEGGHSASWRQQWANAQQTPRRGGSLLDVRRSRLVSGAYLKRRGIMDLRPVDSIAATLSSTSGSNQKRNERYVGESPFV
jgi:hypothetical protein